MSQLELAEQSQIRSEKTMLDTVKTLFRIKLEKPTTITTFLCLIACITIISLSVGIYLIMLPINKQIKITNYGNNFGCDDVLGLDSVCEVPFIIDEDLEGPIVLNYELTNFIENSKDYLGSRSHKQLQGQHIDLSEAAKCKPFMTNSQMGVDKSWGGYPLNPDDIASPCGMQAKLYFRDKFELVNSTFSTIPIRTSNLIDKYFREPNSEKVQWIDPTLDSFEIWMSTSVSPTIQKLFGIIDQSLTKGNYTIRIRNMSNYTIEVGKNLVFIKEKNDYGNSRLLGWLSLAGSLILLVFIVIYYVCEYALRKCFKNQ